MPTLESTATPADEVAERPAGAAPDPIAGHGAGTPDRDLTRRQAAWLLSLVVVIGAALRLWHIGSVGFNSDEAVYAGQGAALFGIGDHAQHFSLFRAHPLLLQLIVGIVFRIGGVDDTTARIVVAIGFGLTTVVLSYLLVARLSNRLVAVITAALMATLPYHVIVSRQVLVDVAMAACMVAAFWMLARFVTGGSGVSLAGSLALLGLAVLAKEIAVLAVVPVGLVLLAKEGIDIVRRRSLWVGLVVWMVLVAAFPLTRLIYKPSNASDFVVWQITREPNHPIDYFLRVLLQYAGPLFLSALIVGLVVMVRRRAIGDLLVLSWVGTFGLFFVVWPTKLFPYLFPIVPGLAYMAATGLVVAARWLRRRSSIALPGALAVVLAVTLTASTITTVGAGPTAQLPSWADFDIEVQSFAGGRELGAWAEGTPGGSRFVTIGPSIGNVLRFYGNRDSVALSVSANPRLRNPAYVPLPNPDLAIRQMTVQYAVWDAYSADRSVFYNARLLAYVRRFDGVPVFAAYVDDQGRLRTVEGAPPEGADSRIVVYDLAGGAPGSTSSTVVDN